MSGTIRDRFLNGWTSNGWPRTKDLEEKFKVGPAYSKGLSKAWDRFFCVLVRRYMDNVYDPQAHRFNFQNSSLELFLDTTAADLDTAPINPRLRGMIDGWLLQNPPEENPCYYSGKAKAAAHYQNTTVHGKQVTPETPRNLKSQEDSQKKRILSPTRPPTFGEEDNQEAEDNTEGGDQSVGSDRGDDDDAGATVGPVVGVDNTEVELDQETETQQEAQSSQASAQGAHASAVRGQTPSPLRRLSLRLKSPPKGFKIKTRDTPCKSSGKKAKKSSPRPSGSGASDSERSARRPRQCNTIKFYGYAQLAKDSESDPDWNIGSKHAKGKPSSSESDEEL